MTNSEFAVKNFVVRAGIILFSIFSTESNLLADVVEIVSADTQTVTGYGTLQEAFDAVAEGETIRVVSDISLGYTSTATQWYTNNVTATLDLNGHTIDGLCASAANGGFNITAGTLILEDGSEGQTGVISAAPDSGTYATMFYLNGTARLVMNSGRISVSGAATRSYGVYLQSTAPEFTMNGGTISVNATKTYAYGVYNYYSKGRITMTGGSVIVNTSYASGYSYGLYNYDAAPFDLSGGAVSAVSPKYAYALYHNGAGKVTITGGDFYAKAATTVYGIYCGSGKPIEVTGGRFAAYKGSAVSAAPVYNALVSGGTYTAVPTIASGYASVTLDAPEAATVNGNAATFACEVKLDESLPDVVRLASTSAGYKSVNMAMNAAAATDTITLLTDVDIGTESVIAAAGKKLTLELNGYGLFATNVAASTTVGAINVYGSLTLQDSSLGGTGRLVAKICAIRVNADAEFTLASGSVNVTGTASTYGIYNYTSGKTTVTGGKIIVDTTGQSVYCIYCTTAAGTVSVSGGDFFARSTSTKTTKYVYLISCTGTSSITGGRYAYDVSTAQTALFSTVVKLQGGEFAFDPSAYLGLGDKIVVDDGTDTVDLFGAETTLAYQIVTDPNAKIVAMNATTGAEYYSPQTAIDAAAAGETIKLTDDLSLGANWLAIADGITLDLNGHSVTSTTSSVRLSGGTAENPIRIIDSAETKGVLSGAGKAVQLMSGKICYVVIDGVTIFDPTCCVYDGSGSSTSFSTLICTNVRATVATTATASNTGRYVFYSYGYANVEVADCDFTLDAPYQTTSSSTSYYLSLFHTFDSIVTVKGGNYRVIGGSDCYANILRAGSANYKPRWTVESGNFAIETGANPKSVAFYATGSGTDTTGSSIVLAGGNYTANIDPALWLADGKACIASSLEGYDLTTTELTSENAVAKIVRGETTVYYASLLRAHFDAASGETVELLRDCSEDIVLKSGVQIQTNGRFSGTISFSGTASKAEETDGVWAVRALTAEDPESVASVTSGDTTTFYTGLDTALSASPAKSTIRLLKDITVTTYGCSYNVGKAMFAYVNGGRTLTGWDENLQTNHVITYTGSASCFAFIGVEGGATLEHLTVKGLKLPLCYQVDETVIRDVDVYGDISCSGNMGIYSIRAWGDVTMIDCTNYATMTGIGGAGDYNGLFLGYVQNNDKVVQLSFTNCVNRGRFICGKAGFFIGNPCSGIDIAINCAGCENYGLVDATYVNSGYNMNWYYAVDGNAPHIILNGQSIVKQTSNFMNIEYDVSNGVVNMAPLGVVHNGPIETGMRLLKLPDGSFYARPADGNRIVDMLTGEATPVAYYTVSIGLYVSVVGGSGRHFVEESFATNDAPSFVTTLQNLDFVDALYRETHPGVISSLAGNKIYTDAAGSHYVVLSDYSTRGETWSGEFYTISAFDKDRNLLASTTLENTVLTEYTVTFGSVEEYGTTPGTCVFGYSATETPLPKPTDVEDGVTFNGWCFPDGTMVANAIPAYYVGDLHLTATWTAARTIDLNNEVSELLSGALAKEIKVTEEWIAENVAEETPSDERVLTELRKIDENGNPKWQNYVLGLEPTDPVVAMEVKEAESAGKVVIVPNSFTPQADTGFSVTYSIDEVTSKGVVITAGEETTSDALNIDVESVEKSAFYKMNVVITKDDGESEPTKIAATNTLAVLKVTEAPATSILAVPWNEVGGEDISVASLVKTSTLTAGDKLYVYRNDGTYSTWNLGEDHSWSTTGEGGEQAETDRIPRGSAVWLSRQDTTTPIVMFGQVGTEAVKTKLEEAASATEASWNIIASPTVEALDLNAKFNAETKADIANDQIIIPTDGAPKTFTYVDNKWGYNEAVSVTNAAGKVRVTLKRVTDDTVIPAGTGAWYLNSGAEKTVSW